LVKLDMIGIVSGDLSASVAFYRLLGLDFPVPDGPYVEATGPGGMRVSINDANMIKQVYGDVEIGGHAIGLAFLCDDPAHVDRLHQTLVDEGYISKLDPFDAFWGQRYATILDPDDNAIDLFAPNPASQTNKVSSTRTQENQ